jgi:ribosomal protein S8
MIYLNFLISQLKLAFKHNRSCIIVINTRLNQMFLESLRRQGYIKQFVIHKVKERKYFKIYLNPSIELKILFSKVKIISSSSRPLYMSYNELCNRYNLSDFIGVLGSKGIMLSGEVFFFRAGGLVLFDNSNYN